jgi:hypothetical protein
MILTRDEILDAIDMAVAIEQFGYNSIALVRLCVFTPSDLVDSTDAGQTIVGKEMQWLMLAFLLAWHDDITGYRE